MEMWIHSYGNLFFGMAKLSSGTFARMASTRLREKNRVKIIRDVESRRGGGKQIADLPVVESAGGSLYHVGKMKKRGRVPTLGRQNVMFPGRGQLFAQ